MGFDNVNVNVSGGQSIIKALQNYNTVILKPNIVDNRNVLTQEMMSERHTKYVIRWNYSLEGATINVPEDCIVEFAGGTIDNGTIVGDNTMLMYSKPIDEVCPAERQGTFIYNTTVADEEDITSESGQLKFKDRPATDGMGRKILRKNIVDGVNTLTQSMMQATNTIYVIQYDFILGEDITVPENCILEFDGGSLSGGTLIGTNTKLQGSISFNANIIIDGTFIKDNIIDASVFKGVYSDDATLLKNASLIGENIKLEDNKHYRIEKRGLTIYTDSIFAETNAYLDFVNVGATDGKYAVNGLNVVPNKNLVLFKNLTVSEDYTRESAAITTGNTLSASKSVEIDGCKFLGSSQSSFFASSNAYSFYAHDCIVTSVKGDHLFYCSMICKSFTLKNIYVTGTEDLPTVTQGIFKVRACTEVVFNVENVKTDNIRGYIYFIDGRSKGSLNLNNITHTAPENQSVSDTDVFIYASIESRFFINIINSNIDCGSINAHPLILYRDGEYDAVIEINNSNITTSCIATGGTVTVKNSHIELKGTRQIITSDYIGYYINSIVNSQLVNSTPVFVFYKINYRLNIEDCTFNNNSTFFITCRKKDVEDDTINSIILINSSVKGSRGLMDDNARNYNLVKNNSIIIHNSGYTDEGDTKPVNLLVGTTTYRPTLINVGFKYFDTTIGKPIWWNGTNWVDATGTPV